MKSIINSITLAVLLILFVPAVLLAQDASVEDAVSSASGTVLAEINLSDADLEQVGDEAKVKFLVENLGTEPQTDIQYGLEIIKTAEDGSQALVDVVVLNDIRTVVPGVPLPVEITYSSAHLAAGTYQVWVHARTPGGLVVGIALAGEVSSESTEALELLTDSCVLSIPVVEQTYHLSDGVDVSSEEDLTLNCLIKNHSTTERQVVPEFVTHERTVYGEVVPLDYELASELTLLPGEEKKVELVLPKATKPQAYDLVVNYLDKATQIVSNKAVVHYVLQGQSATIQAINFDKDSYAAGEDMTLSILWSESADNFPDSRSGGTKKDEVYYFDIVVTDEGGMVCGTDRRVVEANDFIDVQLVSGIACTNPTAAVTLETSTGTVLDTEAVTIVPVNEPSSDVVAGDTTTDQTSKLMFATIGLFALIGVVLLLWYARKNRNHIVADSTKLLVAAVIMGGGLFGGAISAEAVTWSLTSSYQDCGHWDTSDGSCVTRTAVLVTATVNSNKTTYRPGETIVLSGYTQNHTCSNLYYGISARLTGNAELTFFEGRASGIRNFSGTFTAPSTPGVHRINLGVCHTNASNCASSYINITVANPAVNGRCDASHYRCSAGTSASNSNNATNYTWRCNGLNGGSSVSCSENKINGSCAAARNTCTAGVAANGGQTATHYTWSCNSPNGGSNASCTAFIPPAVNLTPTPALIGPGDSSTLNWSVTNATACTASGGTWTGAKSTTGGSNTVSPSLTTIYTLACTGPGGSGSRSATVTLPSGTITATSCTIPFGGTGCNTTVSWNALNFLSTPSVLQGSTPFSTAISGTLVRPATPDNRTFTLDDTGSNYLNTVVAAVNCAPNSAWAGGTCIELPTITISSDPDIVRSGDTAPVDISITANYDLTCTLTGGIEDTFTHTASPNPQTYTETTNPLTSAQIVNLICVHTVYPEVTSSAETRIEVIPTVQEI